MERALSIAKYAGPDKLNIPVTCKTTKKLANDGVQNITLLTAHEQNTLGLKDKAKESSKRPLGRGFTVNEDVKLGLISSKEQAHIRAVREHNRELYTHTERLRKEHDHFIRQVRQTGVTLVTNQARTYGFGDPTEAHLWANFGQGAPECGPIPGGPERNMTLTLNEETLEYSIRFFPSLLY